VRLREIFRYEFAYRLRAPSTSLYALFLFGLAFWMVSATADGSAPVHFNAPARIAQASALFCGLFGLLVTAGLFADAGIRDVAAGMDPLLYTTRLRKTEYLGGRFLAALSINGILLLAIPLGLETASMMPYLEPEAFGPNRLAAYVEPLLLFLWPNAILVGALLFTIAVLTRQVIAVYLGAIGVFISYIVAANYWGDIGNPILSSLADPLGINGLLAMIKEWTAAERNTLLIGFPGLLVVNRMLWLGIAAAILTLLHRTFEFAHADAVGRRRNSRGRRVAAPSEARWTGTVPRLSGVFDVRTRLWQMFAIARESLREAMASRAFPVACAGAIGLVLLWGWNVSETIFDTSTWPVTHLVVATVLSQRAAVIPWVVVALYAGEMIWKERDVRTAEIADAAPVPTDIALLGRFLALVAIIVIFQIACMIGGILIQVLQGYYHLELGIYLRVLFGFNLAEYVLFAALAMLIHVLVNQKYVGYIVVLLAGVFRLVAPQLGVHNLLIYDSAPRWRYSDMNGFGPFVGPFLWFKLYWAAWALLLAVVAILFCVRGPELGLRQRLSSARLRLRGRTARLAGVAIALIITLGSVIFYNTNVLNEYHGGANAGLPQAEYERRYARFEHSPQPVITAANLRVEIYPEQPGADLRGFYRLVNKTRTAIDSVHVVTERDTDVRSISLDRPAKPALVDVEHGYRIYALDHPLAPGDSVRLDFDVAFRPRGFPNGAIKTDVVANGTYFDRRRLPFVGYQPVFELSDAATRKRFALPPQQLLPAPNDSGARRFDEPVRNEEHMAVETVLGTEPDQIAISPGALRRSWMEGDRRYFDYVDDVPTTFGGTVFSARYATLEDRWHDVSLRIFHHPDHRYDLDRMMAGMKASLDYCTRNFGPYPYRQLRIAEIPPYTINGGRAHPNTIAFAEDFFITRVKPGEIDQAFYGTAHEVAHQWWGGQARPAYARGAAFLSESLANYTAMMVTEKTYGPDVARRVYGFQMDRYFSARAELAREVPLVEVEDQPYIAYRKGAVAMYTLRDFIGENAVNAALRQYLQKHGDIGPPYATSLDLLDELRAATPDSLQYLLTDLFETVTLWQVKTERASVERTSSGNYVVSLDVAATKVRADSVGRETETPMNDFVDVGVFAAGKGGGLGAPLYLERRRIHSGKQTIRITVPREPSRAGVDPYDKLIDRDRGDNVVALAAEPPR
jgi:ABC-2 type transport system permease protein